MIPDTSTFNSDKPVLVIGSSGMDIIGRLKGDLKPGTSNPAHIRPSFGGVARNVAENLARLGQGVILVTAVGEDATGDRLLGQAKEAGINIDHAVRTNQHLTGAYLGVLNARGILELALDDMRAVNALTPTFIRRHTDLFYEASLLFMDANLPKETIKTIVTLAKKARLKICADPTSLALAPRLQPHLFDIFLMTPNASEAAIYCDLCEVINNRRQALTAAKELVGKGVDIAIITMAEIGLCYATSETSGYIPAVRTEIFDPTGAGDALTAAVMFALLNDIPLDDAVRLGVSAASLTLRYQGAVVPDLTLEKLFDQLVI